MSKQPASASASSDRMPARNMDDPEMARRNRFPPPSSPLAPHDRGTGATGPPWRRRAGSRTNSGRKGQCEAWGYVLSFGLGRSLQGVGLAHSRIVGWKVLGVAGH